MESIYTGCRIKLWLSMTLSLCTRSCTGRSVGIHCNCLSLLVTPVHHVATWMQLQLKNGRKCNFIAINLSYSSQRNSVEVKFMYATSPDPPPRARLWYWDYKHLYYRVFKPAKCGNCGNQWLYQLTTLTVIANWGKPEQASQLWMQFSSSQLFS